jgi:hypothetical protein
VSPGAALPAAKTSDSQAVSAPAQSPLPAATVYVVAAGAAAGAASAATVAAAAMPRDLTWSRHFFSVNRTIASCAEAELPAAPAASTPLAMTR